MRLPARLLARCMTCRRPLRRPSFQVGAAVGSTTALLLLGTSTASAQLLVKPDNQWRSSLGAGASVSSGNSSSKSVNVTADAVKATDQDKWTLYGRLLYGKDDDETMADQAGAGLRYDRDLSRKWFAFGSGDWLRDRPANLAYRLSVGTGLGYHLY